jgi:hypothetical protein
VLFFGSANVGKPSKCFFFSRQMSAGRQSAFFSLCKCRQSVKVLFFSPHKCGQAGKKISRLPTNVLPPAEIVLHMKQIPANKTAKRAKLTKERKQNLCVTLSTLRFQRDLPRCFQGREYE